jgi:spore protease
MFNDESIIKKKVDKQLYNFRTDLASERREIYQKANKLDQVEGIETTEEQINENIRVERVKIIDSNGEQAIGKPIGNYITIDVKKLKIATEDEIQKASEIVTNELKKLIDKHIQKQEEILVVGLGNVYVTPDSLGPKVINEIDVTRHLINYLPQYVEEGTRPVSAVAPGVLGTTGIETMEILKGIVDNTKPKLIMVIDALASRSIERISSTIQISDTGIVPGAGVGNTRKEISQATLGIPVIAIGIPTVVDLGTIIDEGLDIFIGKLQEKAESNEYLNKLKEQDNYEEIKEALAPNDYNMIVTPKEIDDLIENMKDVIARGINYAV